MGRSNFVRNSYDSFTQAGWVMPTFSTVHTPLVLFIIGFPIGMASLTLGLFESTASRTPLIVAMVGTSFVFFSGWALTTRTVCRAMIAEASVRCCSLQSSENSDRSDNSVEYDKNGDFYVRRFSDPSAGRPASLGVVAAAGAEPSARDPDYKWFGIKYDPAIRNGAIIKLSFRVKGSLAVVSLLLNAARGALIEAEALDDVAFGILTVCVIAISAMLICDGVCAGIFGGERSLSALIGVSVYRAMFQCPVPFEPVHSLAHTLQETIMALELSPWGVLIPALHRFVFEMRTTSTWLLPLFANFLALTYTYAAIHCKGCSAAYLIGLAVQRGFLPKPRNTRLKDDVEVKAISYSIWGPHVQFEDSSPADAEPPTVPGHIEKNTQKEEDKEDEEDADCFRV